MSKLKSKSNPKHKSESPGDMLARLRSILEEKRLKVTHCEEELAKVRADGEAKLDAARAEVAAYLDEVAGILGVKLAKRPGPRSKKSSGDDEAATGSGGDEPAAASTSDKSYELTSRQAQVLALFRDGKSRAEIADELKMTEKAVYQQVYALRKAGVLPDPAASEPAVESGRGEPASAGEEGSARGEVTSSSEDARPDDSDDSDDGDDGDSVVALRAEVARQQAGVRSVPVHLRTVRVRGHAHAVVVDRMGDGSTQADDSGHVHRIYRFVLSMADKHSHGLVARGEGSRAEGSRAGLWTK